MEFIRVCVWMTSVILKCVLQNDRTIFPYCIVIVICFSNTTHNSLERSCAVTCCFEIVMIISLVFCGTNSNPFHWLYFSFPLYFRSRVTFWRMEQTFILYHHMQWFFLLLFFHFFLLLWLFLILPSSHFLLFTPFSVSLSSLTSFITFSYFLSRSSRVENLN